MWPIDRPPQWVGRGQELATLRAGVEALRRDEGAVVWVEGEPGIGKSSLVVEALAGMSELGWDIGWGFADQLTERMPLSVMADCLQVRPGSPDPPRAHAAGLLRSQRLGLFADGDASVNGVEVLISLAEELCAAAPAVLVIDDLQAMQVLAQIMPRRDSEMSLTHQWLPDLLRLALAAGDRQMAQAAAQACQAEAAAETQPARAAAASLRCHGLLMSDPGPLRNAVAHYRSAGPAVELPAALEDLAVVLAERGQHDEARVTLQVLFDTADSVVF